MKKTLFIIIILVSTIQIYSQQTVQANIEGLGNDTIFIQCMPFSYFRANDAPDVNPIGHKIVSSGNRFTYTFSYNEPVYITFSPKKSEQRLISGYRYIPEEKAITLMIKPGEKITIKGTLYHKYLDFMVSGSEFNEQFSFLRHSYIARTSEKVDLDLKLDSMHGKKDKIVSELDKRRSELENIVTEKHFQYIKMNRDKELSAALLLRHSEPVDTFEKYVNYLTPPVRQGIFKSMLDSQIERVRKYIEFRKAEKKSGDIAPDFILKTISGDSLSFYSVTKKYLVLEFWGSWCKPCVSGLPKMKEYYNKFRGRAEFISIACHDNEEAWKNSVQQHQLDWIQLINNAPPGKDVCRQYGISVFPTKLILDEDKKVIANIKGEGEDFYKKMDEIMNK